MIHNREEIPRDTDDGKPATHLLKRLLLLAPPSLAWVTSMINILLLHLLRVYVLECMPCTRCRQFYICARSCLCVIGQGFFFLLKIKKLSTYSFKELYIMTCSFCSCVLVNCSHVHNNKISFELLFNVASVKDGGITSHNFNTGF